jgi:hypothetical protein
MEKERIDLEGAARAVATMTCACPWIYAMATTIADEIVPPPTAAALSMSLIATPQRTAIGGRTGDQAVSSCLRISQSYDQEADGKGAQAHGCADCLGHSGQSAENGPADQAHCINAAAKSRRDDDAEEGGRLAIDVSVSRAMSAAVHAAATKVDALVPGAARTRQSADRRDVVVDFGVYKRDGFDAALDAVRGLPGMADASARDVACRGASRASSHPRDLYNPRFVDIVPRSEATERQGLIATHRGVNSVTSPNGRWAQLCIEVCERDAQTHGPAIVAVIAALVRLAEPGPTTVPSSRSVTWIPLLHSVA